MASLAASLAKVGSSTFLSRILGFIRDLVVARLFGADAATDAFFVAFKIPNFMRRLFAEGAFSMAFVPVLNEYRQQRGQVALKLFIGDISGTLGAGLLLITILGVLGAPLLILLFAPGFSGDADQRELAAGMLRITFPYVLFISLTALAGGILNTYERFGVPAFTPVILNLGIIACALWLAPHLDQPIMALAIGVLVAGLAQLAFQLPFLHRLGLLPRPRFRPWDPGVRRVLTMMGPAIMGVSAAQISLLLDTLLASFLTTGSISWLYYSDRLMEFPLGILAVALGTVILPSLSRQHAARDPETFSATLHWALRWVLLLGLPAAVGLLALSAPLMTTLFHSSEFGAQDVTMASRSLMAYAPGIIGFMGIKVLAPGYYARHDTHSPMRIALIALAVDIAVSLALMYPFGHAGLAIGTTIAAGINAALLLRGLISQGILRPEPGWTLLIAKVTLASLAMGTLLMVGAGPEAQWIAQDSWTRILHLFAWILAGFTLYAAIVLALGIRPRHLKP